MIPNGVAIPQPPATTRRQLLAELGLPQQSRLIGLVGRLWPQKRVKDADLGRRSAEGDPRRRASAGDRRRSPARPAAALPATSAGSATRSISLGYAATFPRLLPHFDVLWSTAATKANRT